MAMAHAPGQPVQPLQYCMTNQRVQPISFAIPIQQQHQHIGLGLQPSPVENQHVLQATEQYERIQFGRYTRDPREA